MERTWLGITISLVVAGLMASPAWATQSITPTTHNFGERAIGSTSTPMAFTLSATCNPSFPDPVIPCQTFENIIVTISTTGDFAVLSENCPEILTGDSTMFTRSCTINVTFTPTASGARSGQLMTGGPTASLFGSGPLPIPPVVEQPPSTTLKKCKKGYKLVKKNGKRKCKKKR